MTFDLSLLSSLHLDAGSTAKGRGGGGGGGGSISIDDKWDAPGEIKASMAFQIIWCIIISCQFIAIIRRLRFVPPIRHKAPYILLAIVTGLLALAYLLVAIYTRIFDDVRIGVSSTTLRHLDGALNCLFHIDIAFRPAVCLWLVHLRGNLAQVSQGKTSKPWVSQIWKRVVDWSLVAMVFVFVISYRAVSMHVRELYDSYGLSRESLLYYRSVLRGLSFTVLALGLLLLIDIAVSLIALRVSQKRMSYLDPVAHKLLVAVLPFVFIDFVGSLVTTIYPEVDHDINYNALYLAVVILNGIIRVGFIGALISTMAIPNASWGPVASLPPSSSTVYGPQQPQHS